MTQEQIDRASLVKDLEAVASWLKKHPDLPTLLSQPKIQFNLTNPEQVKQLAKALGECDKNYSDSLLYVEKKFGQVIVEGVAFRHQVCTKRVTGTERIVQKVPIAFEERVVENEIVEWDCDPILK